MRSVGLRISLTSQALFAVVIACFAPTAIASNSGVTYQGRILRPDGSPLVGANVQFRLQIRTPDSSQCLMYEESQTLDLRNSGGTFSLSLNDGSGTRLDSSGLTLDRIFANRGTFNLDFATCTSGSGTYIPNSSDGRSLTVLFKDETMTAWEPVPPQKLNFVPLAFEAKQVQGFTADSLLRVVNGSGDPLTGLSPLSNAQYTALLALANGTSTTYAATGTLRGSAVPAMTAGQVLGWNGSAWVSMSPLPPAASIATAMFQAGAVDGSALAPNISINTTGTLGSAVTTTRDFKIFAASPSSESVEILAPVLAAGTSYSLTLPTSAGTTGQVLSATGGGMTGWVTPLTPANGGLMIVQDVQPANTAEASVAATWVTRVLNTVNYNNIAGASLSANQITLPAGTYLIEARAPGHACGNHLAVFYNTTDSTADLNGSDSAVASGSATMNDSVISGVITMTSAKVYEVRHIAALTAANGFGRAIAYGPYVLTSVKITKMK